MPKKAHILIIERDEETLTYWTLKESAPYLAGKPGTDFRGNFDSIERAERNMRSEHPDLEAIEYVYLNDTNSDFYHDFSTHLLLEFVLPHDELTEHFEQGPDCSLVAGLTSDVQVSVQSKKADIQVLSVSKDDLKLEYADRNYTGEALMQQAVLLKVRKPRHVGLPDLSMMLTAEVELPAYYPGKFTASVQTVMLNY